MAAHGHLTDEELTKIAEEAEEARPRIGTDAEHIGSGGVDQVDRRAVKLHEAVTEALGGQTIVTADQSLVATPAARRL